MNRHLTPDERTALALGLATETEAELWDIHLDRCEECREELEQDRAMLRTIQASTPPEFPREHWDNMVREARDEARPVAVASNARERVNQSAGIRGWAWRAASLLVVFGLGYHIGANQATERLARTEYAEAPAWTTHTMTAVVQPRPTPEDLPPTSGSYANRILMVKAEDITRRL